ncbi:MAG: response regulator [Yoonia sp.]|nr:response regulator [Yoonia sp.]
MRLSIQIAGMILLLLAAGLTLHLGWGGFWRNRIDAAARTAIRADPDHAFLTGATGVVCAANAVATDRFGLCDGAALSDLLGKMIANPEDVMRRLQHRAKATGAAKEKIVTRNGQFRLGLSVFAADCLVWRLDDLGDSGNAQAGDAATLPMMTVGPNDTVVHINDACRDVLGQRPKALSDVFLDLPLVSGQMHTVQTTNGPVRAIVAVITGRADGRNVIVLPGNNIQQAAPPLRAGWDQIEHLPVPLMKIARNGSVLGSNREARQLMGIADDAAMFQIAELLDGLGRPINDWLREAAEGRGGHVSHFLRGRGKKQDTFVQVTLNPSGDPADQHLVAVLNDVTELKTLEAQFVQSQKMQAIGQLAGGVAHDFNNLLTAISGHCDLLLLRHDEGDQNYSDLIQIHQNANRAASLVGQLLAFSRKQNLQPEVIDLRETLADLTHLLNRLVGEKVTLTLHHDPALAQIKADKRQLEQVLMNLVVNARDAMPDGGEIKISTENLTLKTQMIKDRAVVPIGEYVVVKVVDRGHGIPPEKLPKIFEPFYTTKRTGEGTGLGLSTAYGIVKQTGGFIFAESKVDQGTQFSLLFPSFDLPVAAPISSSDSGPRVMNTNADGVILLVEDEAPVRAFASRALRLHGYTVLEADCAEAALDLLEDAELQVDVFVTDVIMPGLDGPTWVRKALKKRAETKVVFVSGYAEDAFGDGKPQIPNSVFLPKPFSLNALTMTVQQQLEVGDRVA